MAIRIADGKEIKIGTCNEMFFCRYDQWNQIHYDYMQNGLLWRIPLPEEDDIKPGDFRYPLIRTDYKPWHVIIDETKLELEDKSLMLRNPGSLQMVEKHMGLIASVKCYHGLKLPDSSEEARFFWNGKSSPLYLSFLENGKDQMFVCVSCRCCRKTWGFSFNEIAPAISSLWMKLRLWHACTDYWFSLPSKKSEDKPYDLMLIGAKNRAYRLTTTMEGEYMLILVKENNEKITEVSGTWEVVRNKLLTLLENKGEVFEMRNRYLNNKL